MTDLHFNPPPQASGDPPSPDVDVTAPIAAVRPDQAAPKAKPAGGKGSKSRPSGVGNRGTGAEPAPPPTARRQDAPPGRRPPPRFPLPPRSRTRRRRPSARHYPDRAGDACSSDASSPAACRLSTAISSSSLPWFCISRLVISRMK